MAIVVVGDNVALTGEMRSTATLELMGGQKRLLDEVIATGTPVVVVVVSGKPLVLPESVDEAAAVVQAFNPGMHGGQAIAELMFGEYEPSGRLPISIPRHVGQQPCFYNAIRGQHGVRYVDLDFEPRHVFGEGLAYTTFEYGQPHLEATEVDAEDTLRVEVEVTNTGQRRGRETVQVYVRDLVTSVTWADKELKAFTQVDLEAGESRTVNIELPVSRCSIVDSEERRVVEAGDFELLVGCSSKDADLQSVAFTVR